MLKQRTLPMTDTEILSSFNNAPSPEPTADKDAPSTNEPRHRSDLAESIIFCAADMATSLAKAATDLMEEIASLQDLLISRQRELEETEKLLTAAKRFYEEVKGA